MIKNIKIKKELSEEEFKQIVLECEESLRKTDNLLSMAKQCEKAAKEITPATEASLLIVKAEEKVLHAVTQNLEIPLKPHQENILMECYNTKQPLMINDVTRSLLYRDNTDNFLQAEIKDLLLIPVVDDSRERRVLAILWTAITKGSINQYTQKDLDYLTRFMKLAMRFLFGEPSASAEEIEVLNMEECARTCHHLRAKMKREEEYFASIIHDIRTPMNAVMGFLELLSMIETDPEKKNYLETAIRSGESMVTLINDALDLAKMASGQMTVEKQPFDTLKEMSDVAKLFYNTCRKKGVFFLAYLDPSLPRQIVTDVHRLKQILNNLLSNAVKFTPKGGTVRLSIEYNQEIDGIRVSVRDTGIGIAPERQKEIFTPFVQEKSSTSRQFGGTGLGLSISQQLTVLLGGKLQLESQPGKGSNFYFTLPCNTETGTPPALPRDIFSGYGAVLYSRFLPDKLIRLLRSYLDYFGISLAIVDKEKELKTYAGKKSTVVLISKMAAQEICDTVKEILEKKTAVWSLGETFLDNDGCHFSGPHRYVNPLLIPQELFDIFSELATGGSQQKTSSGLAEFSDLSGKTVLVVDDNMINLKFMKEVLQRLHLKIFTVQSGPACLEKLDSQKIDLIFMDENMPEMQGTEVISAIRKKEAEQGTDEGIAIIGLTGDSDNKTRMTILDAGADEVLTKPVKLQEIINTVSRFLASKR